MKFIQLLNPFTFYKKCKRLIMRKIQKYHLDINSLHLRANSAGLPFTVNEFKLWRVRNLHKGKRAFIIGMGPSLRVSDLNKLNGEITFACNKIYLAFNKTLWRPTYYTVMDILVAENNSDDINKVNSMKIFSSWVKPYFNNSNKIIWLTDLEDLILDGRHIFQFSTNALNGVYGGYTVIYTQLQLAFYMGVREIYLLGIDFAFNTPKPSDETCTFGKVLVSEGEHNHFHPDYRKIGERWTIPRLDMQYEAFICAFEAFKKHGGIIYNASRKTKLDVFPIVDLDSVINTKV